MNANNHPQLKHLNLSIFNFAPPDNFAEVHRL